MNARILVAGLALGAAVASVSPAAPPATAGAPPPARAVQDEPPLPPEAQYQNAWYHEIAERRYEDALEIYRSLHEREDLDAALRARSLFRAGVCLQRLGRPAEATETFARVADEFPEIEQIVADARRMTRAESEAEASFRTKVQSLIELLSHTAHDVRQRASSELVKIGPRAAPMLFGTLGKGDYYATGRAAHVLVGLTDDDPSILAGLEGAIRSGDDIVVRSLAEAVRQNPNLEAHTLLRLSRVPDSRIRAQAATALRRHTKSDAVVQRLVELVQDEAPRVRHWAMRSLRSRAQTDHVPIVIRALDDPDEDVAHAARSVLDSILDRVFQLRRAEWLDIARDLSRRIGRSAATAEAHLVTVLGDQQDGVERSDDNPYRWTPSVITEDPGERARVVARLEAVARDPQSPVRSDAVRLLGAAGARSAVEAVATALDAADERLTGEAIRAIGAIDDPAAVPYLLGLLDDTSGQMALAYQVLRDRFWSRGVVEHLVRNLASVPESNVFDEFLEEIRGERELLVAALDSFGDLGARGRHELLDRIASDRLHEGLPVVIESLDDTRLTRTALRAAREFRSPEAVPEVIERLSDRNSGVRMEAITTLVSIGDDRMIPPLVGLLAHDHYNTRERASQELRKLGRPGILDLVLAVLPQAPRGGLGPALDVVHAYASRERSADVVAALDAELLRGHGDSVVRQALGILRDLGDPAALPLVRSYLDWPTPSVRQDAIETIAGLGVDESIEDVIPALSDPHPGVRTNAIEALAGSADPRVLELLAGMLDDSEHGPAIVRALERLADPRAIPALLEHLEQ